MLYPILVEHYVWFGLLLLLVTWFTRKDKPETRSNFMYGYGMIVVLGFLLALDWVAGIMFGLLVLEVGRIFKAWLDRKANQLKK
ncbi:hypothetical protein [Marinomonas posidonica]|uniref:Uncharacterized protein n=1 Tax=Marinomonas posidonica (strain CECT 7376 / NCIMB 14433 / IVIA-Po-181) TaxID=491952 RepID=F6CUL1_MARPP|nr:hypothetical protein [Marinomonas posidonica]AEF54121.1 hypothetical protein Mar181_1072 [Marinomonas posidonica IVIA-Po-181]